MTLCPQETVSPIETVEELLFKGYNITLLVNYFQIGGRNQVKKGLSKLYQIKDKLSFYYGRKYDIYCEL